MNTPPTPKRFNLQKWREKFIQGSQQGTGHFALALARDDACSEFALLVSEFTHLEHQMEDFVSRLMGTDREVAALVMRSVISISARIDLMQALLTRARRNQSKSVEFDEIIREFKSIKNVRNAFVHGRWQTDLNDGTIYLIKPGEDPFVMNNSAMQAFDISEFKSLRNRINDLVIKIYLTVGVDFEKEQ